MSPAVRLAMLLACLPVLGAMLLAGCHGLPGFGHYPGPYGDLINHLAPLERHASNVVAAINFDYRGLDTLGEVFILFAAVAGSVVLMRGVQGEDRADAEQPPAPGRPDLPRSDDAAWLSTGLLGLLVVFGLYVVVHGQLTPGGGFQGGVITATAVLLIYLTRNYGAFLGAVPKEATDALEAFAAGAYALVGIATLLAGGAFLQNLLPLGKLHDFLSAGSIALINDAVGIEVAAGFIVLFLEFAEEVRERPTGEGE